MKPLTIETGAEFLNPLSRWPFLSGKEAETLLPYLEVLEITSGEALWKEGDENTFTAFILSGRLEEKKVTEFADKQIVVGVYTEGSMIGESSLFDNLGRPFTAVCLENARLLILSRRQFEILQQEDRQTALLVLKGAALTLSLRLRKSFDRLVAIF